MESENSNESHQKAIEKYVLEGLVSFFGNPNNFDRIVLSARCKTEQLAKKLDDITDKLVQLDEKLDDLQTKTTSILRRISTGEIPEEIGATMLRFTEDLKLKLREERSELQLNETQLCKQIRAIERFEDGALWCHLYPDELNIREKMDMLKVLVDRVEVYVRMP